MLQWLHVQDCTQEFVCGFELVFPELVLEKSLELAH